MKKLYTLFILLMPANVLFGQTITFSFENLMHTDTSLFAFDSSGSWQIGEPAKPYLNSAISIPNAIVTDTLNPYPVNCNSGFIIKPQGCFYLTCNIKYESDSCLDGLIIESYYTEDSTWRNILADPNCMYKPSLYFSHYVNYTKDTCVLYNGETGISGTGTQIFSATFSFNAVRSPVMGDRYIRFRFVSDNVNSGKDGFLIDDIVISNFMCPTGIEEVNRNENMLVFPNPSDNNIRFTEYVKEITLVDVNGKPLLTKKVNGNSLDISFLTSGVYFIRINDNATYAKFIKN